MNSTRSKHPIPTQSQNFPLNGEHRLSGPCLNLRCLFKNGKLVRKIETLPAGSSVWEYTFDRHGRLRRVLMDRHCVENYSYDKDGRRIHGYTDYPGRRDQISLLDYDPSGRLINCDLGDLAWNRRGALASVGNGARRTVFTYRDATRLKGVTLPNGDEIAYEYGDGLMPERILVNGETALVYQWDGLRLLACENRLREQTWLFAYDERGPRRARVYGDMLYCGLYYDLPEEARDADYVDLDVSLDHVGSVRVLSYRGRPLKDVMYDSFGNLIRDSREGLALPLGFAGGLADPFTGFTRFGFRDYDPGSGRFTAKDPLGDTGGDHDLWEYCVDDPVSRKDPMGLFAWFLPLVVGKLAALGIGLGTYYGLSKGADAVATARNGEESTAASDAFTTVAPMAAGIVGGTVPFSVAPAGAVAAPGMAAGFTNHYALPAYTYAGQRVGAELASRNLNKGSENVARLVEGAVNPVSPLGPSAWGMAGGAASWASRKLWEYWQGKE